MTLIRATAVHGHPHGTPLDDVWLTYDARFVRRKRLVTKAGFSFLVDLDHTTHLDDGAVFVLEDGSEVLIRAADEPLLKVTGDLTRLAWHIGNRHTPCQILQDHLLIRDDKVLRDMVLQLGGQACAMTGPFTPEGGAYGHGRTMGHSH